MAGIALAMAAILAAAQSVWGLVVSGGGYSVFEYGFGAALIPFWVCALVALVGGILLATSGSASVRIRTLAALGGGALFVTVTQNVVVLCIDSYVRFAEKGNWLAIPAAIAILAAVGTLIAGKPGSPATFASPSAIPGYPGAVPSPGPAAYPGVPPGYPAPAVAPNYSAPAVYPAAETSAPAPHGWPSYPGAAAPGYPGAPAPAYPGVPGYPGAPSGAQGDPNAAGPHPVAGPHVDAGTPPAQAQHPAAPAPTGSQPGYASAPEQPGGPDSSSAPTVHADPSGTPPPQPHLPQQ
ncbi:hypothetical protein [Nocardia cerradoensis]|uniref:hypothetical protein n=1 Tax=Nocardia cerradoensis TaxID=85688 RepID=UPI0012F66CF4|nr:hypothetical protein [Nocardia cerradoensis]NKY43994.1 hypothetical protein [Nocardia cerradoensis]